MLAAVARRGALIVLGLVVALLAAELLLQAGAAYRTATGRRADLTVGDGVRILCVGDSHTYGLYLDEQDSYPSQLQRLLGNGVQVVNLGFPGMNSSRLRAELPGMLDAIRPSVVFILIGANDLWTAPVPVDAASERAEGWWSWLTRRSRVYRLLFMLVRGLQTSDDDRPQIDIPRVSMESSSVPDGQEVVARYGDHTFHLGWQPVGPQPSAERPQIAGHLASIVAMVRAHGAEPVVLTYPSTHSTYRNVSTTIAARAREADAPVIDLSAAFQTMCAERDCQPLFFGDGHATQPGYTEVARIVAQWLEAHPDPSR
jgi:lysophospholipase L1-like esterase